LKIVDFLGDSRERLGEFPRDARKQVGFELDRVQQGLNPTDWKPMPSIGPGVREIRVREISGAFRVIYLTQVADRVLVLHAFQKKTQATAKRDIDLAAKRLREWVP